MCDPLDYSDLTANTNTQDPLIFCDPIDETRQLPDVVTDDFIQTKWNIYNRVQQLKNCPKTDDDKRKQRVTQYLRKKLQERRKQLSQLSI